MHFPTCLQVAKSFFLTTWKYLKYFLIVQTQEITAQRTESSYRFLISLLKGILTPYQEMDLQVQRGQSFLQYDMTSPNRTTLGHQHNGAKCFEGKEGNMISSQELVEGALLQKAWLPEPSNLSFPKAYGLKLNIQLLNAVSCCLVFSQKTISTARSKIVLF